MYREAADNPCMCRDHLHSDNMWEEVVSGAEASSLPCNVPNSLLMRHFKKPAAN